MNPIQTTEINQDEFNSDSALNLEVPESNLWEIPDRKTRKQWYQSTNPQIRSYITGNLSANIAGKGARSLKRASDEYQYLSEDLARRSYSSKAMSEKYDKFNGIDSSLLDKALENESKQLDAYQQQFDTEQLSERKFNQLQRKHGRRINNLNENYKTLSEVWHNKHGIPLVRTQSSVSPAPFVLGTVGLPLAIIGSIAGGVSTAPVVKAILNNPLVQGYFAYNSANNLVSDRGVKKTIKHFKNGEIGRGLWSAAGDLMDVATVGFGASNVYKAGKKLINTGIQQAREIQAAEAALFNNRPQIVKVEPIPKRTPENVRLTWEAEFARQHPRIAKITSAEHSGMPKMDRFNQAKSRLSYPQRGYDPTAITPENSMSSELFSQNLSNQISNIPYPKNSEWYKHAVQAHLGNLTPVVSDSRPLTDAPESVKAMKAFVQTLPEDINPKFGNLTSELTGNIESYYITEYRRYLQRAGIDTRYFTTSDLQKLLTHSANHLDSQVTGKLKGVELWHSTAGDFDQFNVQKYLGATTGNNGVYGPGNYFSLHLPLPYGNQNGPYRKSQPFYVTKVNSIVPGIIAHQKGLVSRHYEPPMTRLKGSQVVLGPNTGPGPLYEVMSNQAPYEIAVFKNKGIKSLYAHPSRYYFNEDGTAAFTPTNWDDARFNYKTGGTIPNPHLQTNN
jgi:hypothetical protein